MSAPTQISPVLVQSYMPSQGSGELQEADYTMEGEGGKKNAHNCCS